MRMVTSREGGNRKSRRRRNDSDRQSLTGLFARPKNDTCAEAKNAMAVSARAAPEHLLRSYCGRSERTTLERSVVPPRGAIDERCAEHGSTDPAPRKGSAASSAIGSSRQRPPHAGNAECDAPPLR